MKSPTEIESWATNFAAIVLDAPPAQIDPTATFVRLGLDSMMLSNMVGALEERLGREIEPTLVDECRTIRDLARRLASES